MGRFGRIRRLGNTKQFVSNVKNATKGIDNCPKCSALRKEIIEHSKRGHVD